MSNEEKNSIEQQSRKTVMLAKMGMLVAISIVFVWLIRIPFPPLPFLEYDPADIPILIGAFAFGPLAGIVLTVVTALVQGLTVSAASGPYGIIMHIIATGSYILVAGFIYRWRKTRKVALIAVICGAVAMILIMIPANLFVTPLFMGLPRAAVYPLLPAIIGFNSMKAVINGLVTFILYKPLSNLMHKWK